MARVKRQHTRRQHHMLLPASFWTCERVGETAMKRASELVDPPFWSHRFITPAPRDGLEAAAMTKVVVVMVVKTHWWTLTWVFELGGAGRGASVAWVVCLLIHASLKQEFHQVVFMQNHPIALSSEIFSSLQIIPLFTQLMRLFK